LVRSSTWIHRDANVLNAVHTPYDADGIFRKEDPEYEQKQWMSGRTRER